MPYLERALKASQSIEDFVYGSAASIPLTQVVRACASVLCVRVRVCCVCKFVVRASLLCMRVRVSCAWVRGSLAAGARLEQ